MIVRKASASRASTRRTSSASFRGGGRPLGLWLDHGEFLLFPLLDAFAGKRFPANSSPAKRQRTYGRSAHDYSDIKRGLSLFHVLAQALGPEGSFWTVQRWIGTPSQTAAMAFRAPRAVDDRELGPSQAALDEIVDYTRAAPSGRPRVCKGPQAARWKSLQTKGLIAMSSPGNPRPSRQRMRSRPTRLSVQSLPRFISQGPSPSLASNAAGIAVHPYRQSQPRYAGKHAREAGRWRRRGRAMFRNGGNRPCAVAGGALPATRRSTGPRTV